MNKNIFNLDQPPEEEEEEEVKEEIMEPQIDLDSIEPHKVNWFKYLVDKYLKLTDEEGNPSALNSADAFVNLLSSLLSNKKNEEIQGELLDLVGFHNFELLE